jgi:hypothetical protein
MLFNLYLLSCTWKFESLERCLRTTLTQLWVCKASPTDRGHNFILSQNTYKHWKYAVHNTDSNCMIYLKNDIQNIIYKYLQQWWSLECKDKKVHMIIVFISVHWMVLTARASRQATKVSRTLTKTQHVFYGAENPLKQMHSCILQHHHLGQWKFRGRETCVARTGRRYWISSNTMHNETSHLTEDII